MYSKAMVGTELMLIGNLNMRTSCPIKHSGSPCVKSTRAKVQVEVNMSGIISIIKVNLQGLLKRKTEHPDDTTHESSYQEQLEIAKNHERETYEEFKDK